MADLQRTIAELQRQRDECAAELRVRTAERDAALAREAAIAEVLQVINASPGDLMPVFDAVLEKAVSLSEAVYGHLWRFDGEHFHPWRSHGDPQFARWFDHLGPVRPNPDGDGFLGRAVRGEDVLYIADVRDTEAYRTGYAPVTGLADVGGGRSVLTVALRRDRAVLGVLTVYRREVKQFSTKQISLLQNFAAQAVIAMENARLLTETREALEQQTATAEVLGVINASPGNLTPVFEAMLEKAMALCEAAFGIMATYDGRELRPVAMRGIPPRFAEFAANPGNQPGPGGATPRLAAGAQFVHVADLREEEAYRSGDPYRRALVEIGEARSLLAVPLRKDGVMVGQIGIYRREVRPFTDRQIALLQNFAAQMVIAMENARLLTETREALEQQTATAEVLGVINSSPGDLAPVFDAMLEKATRLCDAAFGILVTVDGEKLSAAAMRNVPERLTESLKTPMRLDQVPVVASVIQSRRFLHIHDFAASDAYRNEVRIPVAAVQAGGVRSVLYVPLVKDNRALGVFVIFRQEVRPFTEKQIALLQNFADQAVIAIENARLLTETREALEQQTATAEVLQVINRSPGDLKPVFEAMLEKAMRLCGGSFGELRTYDGERFRLAATYGVPTAYVQHYARGDRGIYGPGTGPARILAGERVVHIPDLVATEPYRRGDPDRVALVELGGARAYVLVPLLKDTTVLGYVMIYRKEAGWFSDKQIALMENFAAQAVIAMESARLLTETREALEQQTATAEVLQVINSSPGDLAPVFEAMLDKALRLCKAAFGVFWTFDGERFHSVAARGDPRVAEWMRRHGATRVAPDTPAGRIMWGERIVHLADATQDEAYHLHRRWRELVDVGNGRTVLIVGLRKENALLGLIAVYRQEVHPFSDNQIALLQSFAAQAVIAMDNARLLGEIRQRQAELRVTFDNMGDGVAMFDADLRLAAWNRNFQQLLDLSDEFLAARPGFAEYFRHLAERGEYSADLEAKLRRGLADSRQELRFERARPDGRVVEVRRNAVPSGGFVMIYSDITERKHAEEQIRTARDAAERALAELRAAQQQLVVQQKMAALGQLTAGIAHEIKNPLNFVNNFAGLSVELLDELKAAAAPAIATMDADARAEIDDTIAMLTGNLDKIAEHGRRADGIVRSMLQHSRGASGDWQECDVNALLDEALNLAYHGARAQDQSFNITLERDLDRTLAPIAVVPQDMTRVFLNLIGNSFYAANKRGREAGDSFRPVLKVTTRALRNAVEVRVRDNGTGIAPEYRDRLFQPFFTTKPTGEGTGLGLSISHDIVTTQHGGAITVDSEVGEFTEFIVRLPRRRQAATARKGK